MSVPLTTTKLAPIAGSRSGRRRAPSAGVVLRESPARKAIRLRSSARLARHRCSAASGRRCSTRRRAPFRWSCWNLANRAENGSCQSSVSTPSSSARAPTSDQQNGERARREGRARPRHPGCRLTRRGRSGRSRGDRGRTVGHRCLSSQSRLGAPERSRSGVGQRPPDRDLDAVGALGGRRRRGARAASEYRAGGAAEARGSRGRADEADVAAGEEQHGPPRRPRRGRGPAGGRRRRSAGASGRRPSATSASAKGRRGPQLGRGEQQPQVQRREQQQRRVGVDQPHDRGRRPAGSAAIDRPATVRSRDARPGAGAAAASPTGARRARTSGRPTATASRRRRRSGNAPGGTGDRRGGADDAQLAQQPGEQRAAEERKGAAERPQRPAPHRLAAAAQRGRGRRRRRRAAGAAASPPAAAAPTRASSCAARTRPVWGAGETSGAVSRASTALSTARPRASRRSALTASVRRGTPFAGRLDEHRGHALRLEHALFARPRAGTSGARAGRARWARRDPSRTPGDRVRDGALQQQRGRAEAVGEGHDQRPPRSGARRGRRARSPRRRGRGSR